MSRRSASKNAPCPECMKTVTLKKKPQFGTITQCKHCGIRLEVVELFPLELDLAYEEDEFNYDE